MGQGEAMNWIQRTNAYLKGYRTILTTLLGSVLNAAVLAGLVPVTFQAMLWANIVFLIVACIFRILAKDQEPIS